MRKRNEALDNRMMGAGWIRADVAAARFCCSPTAVRAWAGEGKVRQRRVPNNERGVLYVAWGDCVRHFGVDNAVTVGAIPPEGADKFRKEDERT